MTTTAPVPGATAASAGATTASAGATADAGPDAGRRAERDRARTSARTEVAGVPAYLVFFLAFVPADMFSANARQLGFPISPDRLCLAAGLVLLVLDRRPWAAVRPRWRPVHTALIAFVLFVIGSAVAFDVWRTGFAAFALLDRLVVPFVLFTIAPVVFSDPRSRDLLLKVLVVIGLYLGFTAVFEIFGPKGLVFPRYILDPQVGIQFGRARGPFVESEANGLVMVMSGFGAGLLATRTRGAWRKAAVLACCVVPVGGLLTLTRSIWIGALLGVLITAFAVPRLRRYVAAAAVALTIAVLTVLAYVPGLSEKLSGRTNATGPLYDRLNTNAAALRIVEAHPLQGVGWSRFIDVSPEWVRQASTYPITNIDLEVHNVFLGRAAELGLIGAGLFGLCVLLGPVSAFLRRAPVGDLSGWRVVALGAFCAWFVAANTSPLPYPLPNALLWLIAGIASAGYTSRPGPARVGQPAVPLA